MPPYPFLFETRRVRGQPSPDALQSLGQFAPLPGLEVVPTDRGRALVAYLKSLDRTYDVP